jgi:REP element-mobilizing transposase RayT
VQETLFLSHGVHFSLHAWVVMPNHVHILATPAPGVTLAKMVGAVKAASAAKVNKLIGSEGRLWQRGYYDRAIRSPNHFDGVIRYLEWNPVKARLVQDPALYQWNSANESARLRLESVELWRHDP